MRISPNVKDADDLRATWRSSRAFLWALRYWRSGLRAFFWCAAGFGVGAVAGWLIWNYGPAWRVEMILFAGLGLMWIGIVNAADWVISARRRG